MCELLQEATMDQAIQEHTEQLEMMETNHKKQVNKTTLDSNCCDLKCVL